MPGTQIRTVAVVGGGPSGAAVATYLARAGVRVALFQRGKRPPIIVGESLVPAIVPYLRKLGVEDEVRAFSKFKPGASFTFDLERQQSFRFDEVRNGETRYSYNVPRAEFDAALLKAALNAGAQLVETGAVVERGPGDTIRLSDATLAATNGVLEGQPDFIVDATGRTRSVARLLELRTTAGPRRDTALHAHLEGVPLLFEGNVHSDRLERGWAWRIPLPGRVSVGLVVPSEHLRRFGEGAEEQYDGLLRSDPITGRWAANAKRITPVVRYTNYQLRTERGTGPGWALVGDSFGFVDPIFSSGMLIGMQGAEALAQAILADTPQAYARYERLVKHALTIWQRLADYFYDGRLFTLFQVSEYVRQTWFGRLVDFHVRAHLPRIFTGEGTTSRYNVALLDFMIKYGLAGNDPRELEVR
ncbi:MAG TPA: NAD(P)/FAD-dependent oxidoreductase [Myxococcota bacterium]|nr:NAD(P)/FAD-dependent oxidoreductase [Myxococcota bacterium]